MPTPVRVNINLGKQDVRERNEPLERPQARDGTSIEQMPLERPQARDGEVEEEQLPLERPQARDGTAEAQNFAEPAPPQSRETETQRDERV